MTDVRPFNPNTIGYEEDDGEYIVCPNCRYSQGDCWDWVMTTEREHECPGCGAVLAVRVEYDATYYARVVGPPRDSDGSGEAGETRSGSTEGDSAGRQASPETVGQASRQEQQKEGDA